MSDIINIGGIAVSKFYLGGSSDVKIYLGTTKLYPHLQEPCFAVVYNISTYTARTYVDVYETSSDKWYKLNNLSAYEEYGVYGSGRTITTYEGKLTIDGDYEYQYSGGSWVNVGEISGSTRVPQGYTEVEYVENTSSAYINLNIYPYNSANNSYYIEAKFASTKGTGEFEYLFSCEQGNKSPYVGLICRWSRYDTGLQLDGTNYTSKNITNNQDGTSGFTITSNLTNATNTTPITLFCGLQGSTVWRNGKGKIYSFKATINDNLVRDMIPCKRDSDSMVGMYDIVNDVFYYPPNYTSYQLVAGSATGTTIYPIYYDVIQDPPNNLSFSSMTEAEEYECPWVGMKATIDGDNYVFSGDAISGYEWVYQALPYDAEIEYLESSGSQYINTNQYLNTSNFEIGYSVLGNRGHWGYVHNNVVNGAWVTVDETTAFFGSWNNTDKVSVSSYISSTENTIVYTQSGATINGTTISKNFNLRGVDNLASVPLLFFALHDFYKNRLLSETSKFKSFYLKNNGTLVVDMIPVRVGQVGYMYDRVSGQLFGNAGTGSFILGPDK